MHSDGFTRLDGTRSSRSYKKDGDKKIHKATSKKKLSKREIVVISWDLAGLIDPRKALDFLKNEHGADLYLFQGVHINAGDLDDFLELHRHCFRYKCLALSGGKVRGVCVGNPTVQECNFHVDKFLIQRLEVEKPVGKLFILNPIYLSEVDEECITNQGGLMRGINPRDSFIVAGYLNGIKLGLGRLKTSKSRSEHSGFSFKNINCKSSKVIRLPRTPHHTPHPIRAVFSYEFTAPRQEGLGD